MSYFAEINPATNTVVRVIVADSQEWCEQHLGGTWAETSNPYAAEPQTVTYCGPGFTHDPSFPERFAPEWVQPSPDPETGVWSSYPRGAIVAKNGRLWKSTVDGNVWEPGVSAWHDQPIIDGVLPVWVQPTGAHDMYPAGFQVTHNGKRWESTTPDNVWEPGVFGWADLDAPTVGAWVQPLGAQDAYQIGDRVTYNGQTWESTEANNVWAPGVFGWVVV